MRLTQEYTLDIENRFKYATIAVLLLFIVVVARLYYLQIIRGNFYRFFSNENSIKSSRIQAVRGMIFDRRGHLLVGSRPAFNIVAVPQYVVDYPKMRESMSRLLGISGDELDAVWEKRKFQPHYQPLVIKSDVSEDEVALIKARKNPWFDPLQDDDLRGVDVEVAYQRLYPDENIATHLMGYVREIDSDRLGRYREKHPGSYKARDMVGISGIEEEWDIYLRGEDGSQERIVNAVGREVSFEGITPQLADRPARAGMSLHLTIDRDLQVILRDMFAKNKKSGAGVAIDVRNGAILAMYSSPSYDLNKLASPEGSAYWNKIAIDPEKPLINRAIQGGYPPGSTYKIVNAIGALSEGVVRPDENLVCRGALMYGGRVYHCWRKGGHGAIGLHKAIVSSCDVYFYLTGLRLGVDGLAKYADIMGLGRKTGLPLPGEKEGLIPTSEWKLRRYNVPWQSGETLSISVGQGYDVVTPVQNALMVAQVANGGKKMKLHLVDRAYDAFDREIYRFEAPANVEALPINPEVMEIVRGAMVGVVSEPDGTAHAQTLRKVTMGGKTGTAQVIQLDGSAVCKSDACRDHAWFVGFAPADEPEIAAAVVVEHGGFGASAAAPIVGAILEKYYLIEHNK